MNLLDTNQKLFYRVINIHWFLGSVFIHDESTRYKPETFYRVINTHWFLGSIFIHDESTRYKPETFSAHLPFPLWTCYLYVHCKTKTNKKFRDFSKFSKTEFRWRKSFENSIFVFFFAKPFGDYILIIIPKASVLKVFIGRH